MYIIRIVQQTIEQNTKQSIFLWLYTKEVTVIFENCYFNHIFFKLTGKMFCNFMNKKIFVTIIKCELSERLTEVEYIFPSYLFGSKPKLREWVRLRAEQIHEKYLLHFSYWFAFLFRKCEGIFHGRCSGIDNTVCTYGGAIKWCGGSFQQLQVTNPPRVLVVDTHVEVWLLNQPKMHETEKI